MDLVELDPSSASAADFAGWHQVLVAAIAHDLPGDPLPALADITAELRHPFASGPTTHWLGRLGGVPAGICSLELPLSPNEGIGEVDLYVTPALRRQGLGRALVGAAIHRLRDERRTTMTADAAEGTAGPAFATALGLRPALIERGSVLPVPGVDGGLLDEIVATSAVGYRIQRWTDCVPEKFADSYSAAKAAMSDAPMGDLVWQQPTYDSARLRSVEATMRRRGRDWRVVAAVHERSNSVAGLTELAIPGGNPRRATQEDTAVVPAHRGHGLGLVIKADMLRWVRAGRPEVAEIQTWNAEGNAHMLAINDRLGFRPDRTWLEYQAEVATVAAAMHAPSGR